VPNPRPQAHPAREKQKGGPCSTGVRLSGKNEKI
jgi:hypothetical protein